MKKLVKRLWEQRRISGIGEFIETLSLTLFWGTILNMVMNAGTFYYTTLRNVWPWFSLTKFIVVIGAGILVAFLLTYKFVAPSIWQFRGRMMGPGHTAAGGAGEKKQRTTVIIAGGFDPLNGVGHISHIHKARELGDRLVVILSRDDQLWAKHNKPNGTFYPTMMDRIAIMRSLRDVDEVVANIDSDTTCALTLQMLSEKYPQDRLIFAKGGDRTPDNMPQSELETCARIGCSIVYNVGCGKTTSSSQLVNNAASSGIIPGASRAAGVAGK